MLDVASGRCPTDRDAAPWTALEVGVVSVHGPTWPAELLGAYLRRSPAAVAARLPQGMRPCVLGVGAADGGPVMRWSDPFDVSGIAAVLDAIGADKATRAIHARRGRERARALRRIGRRETFLKWVGWPREPLTARQACKGLGAGARKILDGEHGEAVVRPELAWEVPLAAAPVARASDWKARILTPLAAWEAARYIAERRARLGAPCAAHGCGRPARKAGLCDRDYRRQRRANGDDT